MEEAAPSIIRMDPPAHNRHRKLAIGAFTPRMVAALEPRVRALARESVAAIRPGEPFDFVEQVAIPLPMFVIAELLGVPSSDYDDFRRWSDVMIEAGSSGPGPETLATVAELFVYMTREGGRAPARAARGRAHEARARRARRRAAQRRRARHLLPDAARGRQRDHAQPRSPAACTRCSRTARSGRSCARIPRSLPNAVEEMLRYVSPIQNFVRRVQHDTELGGQEAARRRVRRDASTARRTATRPSSAPTPSASTSRGRAPIATSPSASASTSASAPRSRASRRA